MRLLLVDYLSVKEHQNFNKIHVESLLRIGFDLHLVGRKGQFDNIDLNPQVKITYMPEWLFKTHSFGQLTERLTGIMRLWWLNKRVKPVHFDATIFLIYDIFSMFFYRNSSKTYLINHNNVSQLSNRIKYWLTAHLPSCYVHIVLNEEMERRLINLLPHREVKMVPHGICPPSFMSERPSFIKEGEKFLFCPVNRNYDADFVRVLFESEELRKYLNNRHLKLYFKDTMPVRENSVVVGIHQRLDNEFYNYLLKESVAVILPYGQEFQYRSSGIMFECLSYNKPIIANNIEAMRIYREKVEMKLFSNAETLINGIDYYMNHNTIINNIDYFNPDNYWGLVINR